MMDAIDARMIIKAAKDIEELLPALKWLYDYGASLQAKDESSFELWVRVGVAGTCEGAVGASAHLARIARLHIQLIVEQAIKDAENTIEMRRQQIVDKAEQ